MKELLPRPIRVTLYCLAIAAAVASPIIGVAAPDYGVAIATAAGVLTTAAGGTALANMPSRRSPNAPRH